MDITQFKQLPLLGILRGIKAEDVAPLVDCILDSGLKTIEVTMNTVNASDLIRQIIQTSKGQLTVGAGTVLTKSDLDQALEAGATFIVSPTYVPEVVSFCQAHQVPVFPGALTPQEILNAWQAGATMVKIFPSALFGPDYFRDLKGPFDQIELLACGGVTAENIGEYFTQGASGIAFGASLFKKDWIESKEFKKISESLRNFVKSYHNVRKDRG